MASKYCLAVTNHGRICKKKCQENNRHCKKHSSIPNLEKPEECSICLESICDVEEPLSCGHWLHRKCLVQWKSECPICRRKVALTSEEKKLLQKRYDYDSIIDEDELSFDFTSTIIINGRQYDGDEGSIRTSIDGAVMTMAILQEVWGEFTESLLQ